MPTPSSTMPVARQSPSRLRQCGAKSARRAPTWNPSTFLGCGSIRRLARLLASLEGSWTGPSGASWKGRLLCDRPLCWGCRRAQPVKHRRPRSCLLGWLLRAGLDFFLSGESHWWACHTISLSDGSDLRLKYLSFRTNPMMTFKRRCTHCTENWGLEIEVPEKGITAQQLQVRRRCKTRRHRRNLSLLDDGQLLSEKFGTLILGGKLFNNWSHHRVRQRCVNGGPPGQLLGVQTYTMRQVVWSWGLAVDEAMIARRFRGIESISMDLVTVRLPREDVLYREELERWSVIIQGLRQRRLHHLFVLFKSLSYPCRGRHGVLERRLVQPGHSVRNLCLTQVQQRGPCSSLSLGRVDLERSPGRSDRLPEGIILRSRNLLPVALSILVLQMLSWNPCPMLH